LTLIAASDRLIACADVSIALTCLKAVVVSMA